MEIEKSEARSRRRKGNGIFIDVTTLVSLREKEGGVGLSARNGMSETHGNW